MRPDRIIIGTTSPTVGKIMKQLYSPFMRKGNRILLMDAASAEMTKYAANTMLAARISFMNEISELCAKTRCGCRVGQARYRQRYSDWAHLFCSQGSALGAAACQKIVRATDSVPALSTELK